MSETGGRSEGKSRWPFQAGWLYRDNATARWGRGWRRVPLKGEGHAQIYLPKGDARIEVGCPEE